MALQPPPGSWVTIIGASLYKWLVKLVHDLSTVQTATNGALFISGLTLQNNTPSGGNICWSACTLYYQGIAYAIAASNTAAGELFVTWTVGASTFTIGNSYTPGPTVFPILTNNQGTADVTWDKVGAAAVQASQMNDSTINVQGLVLTNNSPGAGNVAWTACTVYYQGNSYAITAGNTTSGHTYITWTVGNTAFTEGASYTPGPTVFAIATNNGGTGDITWNKAGSISVQGQHLFPVLTFDGPNGSLIVSNVTFSDNTPSNSNIQWSACSVTYKGVTYSIPSGNTTLGQPWIFWQLASPTSFQFSSVQPSLGPDDFMIGGNVATGASGATGFFSRAYSFANHTGARMVFVESFVTQINAENNACWALYRSIVDGGGTNASGLLSMYDGFGNETIRLSSNTPGGGGGTPLIGVINTVPTTFAKLPTGREGDRAFINDGPNTFTFGAVASGGGASRVPVYRGFSGWQFG